MNIDNIPKANKILEEIKFLKLKIEFYTKLPEEYKRRGFNAPSSNRNYTRVLNTDIEDKLIIELLDQSNFLSSIPDVIKELHNKIKLLEHEIKIL